MNQNHTRITECDVLFGHFFSDRENASGGVWQRFDYIHYFFLVFVPTI